MNSWRTERRRCHGLPLSMSTLKTLRFESKKSWIGGDVGSRLLHADKSEISKGVKLRRRSLTLSRRWHDFKTQNGHSAAEAKAQNGCFPSSLVLMFTNTLSLIPIPVSSHSQLLPLHLDPCCQLSRFFLHSRP